MFQVQLEYGCNLWWWNLDVLEVSNWLVVVHGDVASFVWNKQSVEDSFLLLRTLEWGGSIKVDRWGSFWCMGCGLGLIRSQLLPSLKHKVQLAC